MGLESGTWVEDLVITNPPSTDDKRQGDDHLRLIKSVLKNTFKRTSGRPVFFPTSVIVSNNYTILDVDENTIFRCDTTVAPFNLTLPNTLTTANAGWKIIIVKVNTSANPVFIVPPTGTLDGFAKIRRTTENKRTEVMWTGVGWIVTRPDSAPIGSTHEYYGTTLPNGYLWPDGTTFNLTDFTELGVVLGTNVKPDLRGRASFGRDDMGGSAANRVTPAGSGVLGTTLKAVGGEETHTLVTGEVGTHSHVFTTDPSGGHRHNAFISDPGHSHNINVNTANTNGGNVQGTNSSAGTLTNTASILSRTTGVRVSDGATLDQTTFEPDHDHTGTSNNNTGGGGAHQNMPPTIVCNKIMVAE